MPNSIVLNLAVLLCMALGTALLVEGSTTLTEEVLKGLRSPNSCKKSTLLELFTEEHIEDDCVGFFFPECSEASGRVKRSFTFPIDPESPENIGVPANQRRPDAIRQIETMIALGWLLPNQVVVEETPAGNNYGRRLARVTLITAAGTFTLLLGDIHTLEMYAPEVFVSWWLAFVNANTNANQEGPAFNFNFDNSVLLSQVPIAQRQGFNRIGNTAALNQIPAIHRHAQRLFLVMAMLLDPTSRSLLSPANFMPNVFNHAQPEQRIANVIFSGRRPTNVLTRNGVLADNGARIEAHRVTFAQMLLETHANIANGQTYHQLFTLARTAGHMRDAHFDGPRYHVAVVLALDFTVYQRVLDLEVQHHNNFAIMGIDIQLARPYTNRRVNTIRLMFPNYDPSRGANLNAVEANHIFQPINLENVATNIPRAIQTALNGLAPTIGSFQHEIMVLLRTYFAFRHIVDACNKLPNWQ